MTDHTQVVIADSLEFCHTNHKYERVPTKPMRIVLYQGNKSETKYGSTGDCLKVFIGEQEVISFTLDFGATEVLVPYHYDVSFEHGNDYETIKGYEVAKFKAAFKAMQQFKEAMDEVNK